MKLQLVTPIENIINVKKEEQWSSILGDPGAVSGGGKKSKRARKKFGRRKVKNDEKSPWGQVLNGPVPNGRGSSGF